VLNMVSFMLAIVSALLIADLWFTYTGASGSQGRGTQIIERLERMESNQVTFIAACMKGKQ
jgi:hypothetical protein